MESLRKELEAQAEDKGWYVLKDRKDQFGLESKPENPACKVHTYGCSEAMKGDICFWHFYRMGKMKEFMCGCPGKKWKTVVGDSTGRSLARKYYELKDVCTVDFAGHFSCCGTDYTSFRCGEMRVCSSCKDQHPSLEGVNADGDSDTDSDTDNDEPIIWPHNQAYKDAVMSRMDDGKPIKYAMMTSEGPTFRIPDSMMGSLEVKSASSALIAAGRNPAEAEWWIWIAGWYDDCPVGITNHIVSP